MSDQLHECIPSNVKLHDFAVEAYEPTWLNGLDRAPNPVEYPLLARAVCQEIAYRLVADNPAISRLCRGIATQQNAD